jgi:3-hydroxyisobutyrate dehydrogenase-like beta-hydroxyacid dehydrogenase
MSKIAIVGMGGMGHRMAAELTAGGHEVLTCLAGRGALSKARAKEAGARDVGSLDALVRGAEIILSVMPPEHAPTFATKIATACKTTKSTPHYVDCNAVSPQTAIRIGKIIVDAGAKFADGGIIGMPPQNGKRIRLYVSGADLDLLARLDGHGMDVKPVGPSPGQASGLKMCYAALTKGQMTLHAAVLMLAHALDLFEPFSEELEHSQNDAWQRMQLTTPFIAPDSGRWVGEMREIAATFGSAHLPTGFHDAAAQVFEAASSTPLAEATRETADFSKPLSDVVALYADACQTALTKAH